MICTEMKIIEEVWKNREAYAASHNHDLAKIVDDLMERQKKSGRMVVDRRPIPDNDINADEIDTPFQASLVIPIAFLEFERFQADNEWF